jgi:hypothetical protein
MRQAWPRLPRIKEIVSTDRIQVPRCRGIRCTPTSWEAITANAWLSYWDKDDTSVPGVHTNSARSAAQFRRCDGSFVLRLKFPSFVSY